MVDIIKTFTFLVITTLLCTGSVLIAQLPDGTRSTEEWIEKIRKNWEEEEKTEFNESDVRYSANLSVIAYVIRDINGSDNCTEEAVKEAIERVNGFFDPLHVMFSLQPIVYVNDYTFASVSDTGNWNELVTLNSAEKTVNLYLVESARADTTLCYGFTFFPDDTIRNYIFLDKKYLMGNYLVTLMGHFFGLLSTHDTLGGYENANEINCAESGDFICDTWADPNLFGWVDSLCTYSGDMLDPLGDDYVPSVANLMSESYDACKCIFTSQQYRRMLFCLKKYRYYLR
jgi:hypothetical protein